MSLNNIVRNFNNNVSKSQIVKGQIVLKKNLVLSVEEELEESLGLKRIMCEVKSESDDDVYLSSFDINIVNDEVVKTECECKDHYNHCFYKDDYFCKHLTGAFFSYIEKLKEKDRISKRKNNLGEEILKDIEKSKRIREHLNLEVNINREESYMGDYFKVSFKIGKDKFYSIKSLEEFIKIKEKGGVIPYGRNIDYSNEVYRFNREDEKIIDFIKDRINILELLNDNKSKELLLSKKYLNLHEKSLRGFLELCIGKEINFNENKVKVVKEDLKSSITLYKNGNGDFELRGEGENPLFISKGRDVYVYEDEILLPSREQLREIGSFFEEIISGEKIIFKESLGNRIFNELIPNLEKAIKSEVELDKSIEEIKREELKVEFYCDSYKKTTFIEVKLIYGENEIGFFNEESSKIILRDGKKEEEILEKLEDLGLLVQDKRFVFPNNEEALYNFLLEGFKELKSFGEVYYSERFKERRVYLSPRIQSSISKTGEGFLNFSFEIDGVSKEEYDKILKAFRENKRFFKLKDNSFLSLENKDTSEFLKVLDLVAVEKQDLSNLKIENSRAFLIGDFIEKSKIKDIRGVEHLNEIREKLLDFTKKDFEVPTGINATLREYQVVGFNWFKTLSYLEFGGILADEMGLGKTLQTITFLQSEKGKKSLVITPTSLLYNWEKEFLKFSTGLNIAIIHGSKNERVEILKRVEEYDVLITTYGTLRNDEQEYSKLFFDYCIIDEAQNIKNPLSQNSKAVKNINCKVRFALTGTPIENNLLELWSIFDFIMPSYLYGSTVFKKRFIEDENGSKKLQRYIAPFILRRLKKDVILELPDKIEKKYYVELTKEQKKLYSSYVGKVKEELKGEAFDGNKITIFSYLTKLRQLCLEPSILVENYNGGNAKLKASLEIIKESVLGNHKVLLFSQFTSVLATISKELNNEGIEHYYLDGSTKASKRVELVENFNEDKEKRVFLISLKAGGTGLNLTSADVVIHFDPWWNPAIENQATDRAHRIGQKNVVEVFKLIAEGTIEERILALQESKKELINSVISDEFTGDNILKNLSVEELINLFE